ncbi:hypothetical protein ACL02S_09715 [Nocardia sp. 004]|uniref:hypothetical protein n=1 Tax=Nocardia sp. 004 TaxID=3385978 RepID=UPI0039A19F05
MVGVLIRMRLLSTRRALTTGWQGVLFALGLSIGMIAAVITAAIIGFAVRDGDVSGAVTVAATLFGIWTLGWLCGPVLMGGGDETVQPEQLRLLPLPNRQLAAGLLAAALAGPVSLVNLVAFGGLIVLAVQLSWTATVVAVAGVVLQLIFVVLLSRVILAWAGVALRSRRGKDLGVVLAGVVGLAYYPMSLLISRLESVRAAPHEVTTALRSVPSGWAPAAVESVQRGDRLGALLPLAGLAVLSLVLWQAWSVLLDRRLTVPPHPAVTTGSGVLLRRVRPNGPVTAVVLKELRTWWRDSRRRATLLPVLITGFLLPVFFSVQGSGTGGVAFAGITAAWFSGLAATNLYGFDGTAVWQTLVTPGAARVDIRGRLVAVLLVIGIPTTLATLVLPGALGRWELYPWVLSLLPAVLGIAAGAGVFLSVAAPYAVPPRTGNPFAVSGNPGCAKGLAQTAVSIGQLAALLPVLAILGLADHFQLTALAWVAVGAGIAVGGSGAVLGARAAERLLQKRGPELLAAVRYQ